jgi:hypothetical protein
MKQFEARESDIMNINLSADTGVWMQEGAVRKFAAEKWDLLQQYLLRGEKPGTEPLRLVALYSGWATMICENGSLLQGWACNFTYHLPSEDC